MRDSRANDLLVFLSVVETGSFVAGGKACGLSRSTAGKAIARLENAYGTRLFHRTTRALSLTQEGDRLYEHGLGVREALAAADASVGNKAGSPSGTLRLAAPDALGRRLILPVVNRFLAQWPDVKVVMSLSDQMDHLIDNGFDLAIRINATSPDTSFVSRTLRRDHALLCAAPDYFQHRQRPTTIEHLSRHDLLSFSSRGERLGWRLKEGDGPWVRASGQIRLSLDSAEALRSAALAGMGVAMLPTLLVAEDVSNGALEHVLPMVECPSVPLIALYPHRQLMEPRVRRFLDFLITSLAAGQDDTQRA